MLRLTWLGHSAFIIESESAALAIDPWTQSERETELLRGASVDLIALTHGHFDHIGSAIELATESDVPIVAVPELAAWCRGQGATAELINFGGSYVAGSAAIKCVPAWHSSSVGPDRVYAGNPCGFVVTVDGTAVYHAGDTCLFGDMQLIGDGVDLDVAILPIGGRTTMDPAEALRAVELLRPRVVIPMHFGTWDFIAQDADAFCREVEARTGARALRLAVGESTPIDV